MTHPLLSNCAVSERSDLGQALFDRLEALPSASRMTTEQLEVIYALAYSHLTQNRHAQALPIFSFLCLYGPTRKHYLDGLALCLQMCERYEESIDVCSLMLTLFPNHYEAAMRTAECQLLLEQFDDAIATLKYLTIVGTNEPVNSPWLDKVKALHKLLTGETA